MTINTFHLSGMNLHSIDLRFPKVIPIKNAVLQLAMFSISGLQDLNIFNFFYVDDQVAVAQGRGGIRSFTAEMGRCLTGHPEVLPAVWRYGGQRILIGTTNISSQWKAKCHRKKLQFWNWDPWWVNCMYPNCRYPICIFQLIDWVLVVGPPTSEPLDNKDLVRSFQCRH